jgi:RimJ/RimL family protein N-acetyltransferase
MPGLNLADANAEEDIMGLKPLTDAPVGGRDAPRGGEHRFAWFSGALAVLGWRARVASQLLRKRPGSTLGNALVFGVLVWLGLIVTEIARRSPAAQAGLAATAGLVIALWHATGQLLRQTRQRLTAVEPVVTERLVLRGPRSRDSRAYAASLDADMMSANGWTEAMRRGAIAHMQHADRIPLLGRTVIADRVTDELLGWISLHDIDEVAGSCELGWSMGPHARGKGYGTEAVRAALDALHRNGYRRITVGTNEDNRPARRVLERVGAHQISARPHTLPNGATVTSVWYVHPAPAVDPETAPTA